MSGDNDPLLWLDLETTGSDESVDEIIEVACIVTTTDLVGDKTFSHVVRPSSAGLGRIYDNDIVYYMHRNSGLLDDCRNAHSLNVIEANLTDWLATVSTSNKFTLAGSGVGHFDMRFVRKHMPNLARRLNYPVIDVGVIRRAYRMWTGETISTANDSKTHRALDDIRCHLEEARAYQAHWQKQKDRW